MAAGDITITQDNTIGAVDLVSVHNPVVVIAEQEHGGTPKDTLFALISGNTYIMTFYKDLSLTVRSYLLIADEIYRAELDELVDVIQTANTTIAIGNLTAEVLINVNDGVANSNNVTIIACHAANDFESEYGQTMVDEYNNEPKYYIAALNKMMYLYWYNNNASNYILDSLTPSRFIIEFTSNPTNGQQFTQSFKRQYISNNPNCGGFSIGDNIVAGTDFAIGIDISETIDNFIAYLEGNSIYQCFTFEKSGNELIMYDQSFFYNERSITGNTMPALFTTENNIGTYAALQIIFTNNLSDGTNVAFDWTDENGNTVNTTLTARNVLGGPNDFLIGVDNVETMNNYYTLLLSLYPTIGNLYNDVSGQRLELQANFFTNSFVDNTSSVDIIVNLTTESAPTGGVNLDKGFIRKAIEPNQLGEQEVEIFINSVRYTHTINVRNFCEEDRYIKYVDSKGQYRFISSNRFYARNARPEAIGSINELVTNIKDDASDTKQIGFKNQNRLTLTVNMLNKTELALMEDLYNSSQIYLMVGSKWVRVELQGDNRTKLPKRKFTDIVLTVKLPKSYNVTQL